ncbi:MAG: DUF2491 family protein [Rhodospirillaceae bacterium]|nr:DUF2491 family protein [Rhodospirillales bacterium]
MITSSRSLRPLALRLSAAALAVLWGCRALPMVAAPATVMMFATEAEARAGSSGGYSRPSVRTPSARAPSGSGGYRRPSVGGGALSLPRSSSDVEMSRRGSAEALQRYRDSTAPRRPSTRDTPTSSRRGWTPPPYATQTPGLGMGQALMMWFLLDTLTRPGHADFFHNRQDDPAYRDWRREAEKRAESDPELRAKLNALDADLAQRTGQPKDPNFVPPDAPKSGPSFPLLPVALLAITLLVLWRARKRLARGTPGGLAGRMLREKISPTAPASPFRVGMTLTLDPTPFVLAQSATKVRPPIGTLVSATAISRLDPFDRIYLAEGFFQLHRTGSAVDECRWFSPLDQFTPADQQEWAFWLDPAEGMIGWPSFETKDGKTYQRLWQPGSQRIAPRVFTEQVSDVAGTTARQVSAMLYAAPPGLSPPAPDSVYVWVAMVEAAGHAWVEIHAGLDVNPASLSLPL